MLMLPDCWAVNQSPQIWPFQDNGLWAVLSSWLWVSPRASPWEEVTQTCSDSKGKEYRPQCLGGPRSLLSIYLVGWSSGHAEKAVYILPNSNTLGLFKHPPFEVSATVMSRAGSRGGHGCRPTGVHSPSGSVQKNASLSARGYVSSGNRFVLYSHIQWSPGKDSGNVLSKVISLQQAAYSGWPVGATVEEWLDPEVFQHQSCRGSQGLYSSDLLYTGRKKHKTQTLQIFLTTLQLRCSIRNVKTMFFEYEEIQITVHW